MTLTERLARPLSQTEAQVADMRRAMDDLRHQGTSSRRSDCTLPRLCTHGLMDAPVRRPIPPTSHFSAGRQRVAALITEGIALQDRVADLDAALAQVEAVGKAKCGEIAAAIAAEIQRVEGEKKAIETALLSARAELAMTNQFKQQLTDLQVRSRPLVFLASQTPPRPPRD